MEDIQVLADSLCRNAFAKESWVSSAHWAAIESSHYVQTEAGEEPVGRLEALMVAVPPSVHGVILQSGARATASFLSWGTDSGIGLVTLEVAGLADKDRGTGSGRQGVVTILDVAGRADLGHLQSADARGRTCLMAVSDAEPDICPWVPVSGLSDALSAASKHRRLAAAEFVSAIVGLRWLMRSPAVYPMLGLPMNQEIDSLCLSVCRPL